MPPGFRSPLIFTMQIYHISIWAFRRNMSECLTFKASDALPPFPQLLFESPASFFSSLLGVLRPQGFPFDPEGSTQLVLKYFLNFFTTSPGSSSSPNRDDSDFPTFFLSLAQGHDLSVL